jgi:dipeptidyl-peptidase-4
MANTASTGTAPTGTAPTGTAPTGTVPTDTFPRQQARTKRFALGVPRSFQISPDGRRVTFLRSKGGTDPVTCLWVLDLPANAGGNEAVTGERLVVDPEVIDGETDEPATELARRERSREVAAGVVAFATDGEAAMAAFALAGQVYVTSLAADGQGPRPVSAMSPAIDPRPDPSGQRVAYVCNGALRVTDLATGADTELIGPGDAAEVSYGLAEFVAAEEMHRFRGYWWSADGTGLLVARVDNAGVHRWHIADPANPDRQPAQVSYPAAGTPNAIVSLLVVQLDGTIVPVQWDAGDFPYLAAASWDASGPMIVVQSRDQGLMRLLTVNAGTGETAILRADSDPHWLDLVPGLPARTEDGAIVWTVQADGARRLLVASAEALTDRSASPVTPSSMQVREVLSVDGDTVLFAASDGEPTEIGIWAYGPGGLVQVSSSGCVCGAVRAGGTTVLTTRSLAGPGVTVTVLDERSVVTSITSAAARPMISPRVTLLRAGQRELRAALLLPSWYKPESAEVALPVLMDPYGGPHAQRVLASHDAYLTSQWFADQGFAVIVADGRGTPGRGPDWDRTVADDLAGPVLEDQVDALASVAEQCARQRLAELDLTKVGIRGWSFGGYLAALAVLRRPDVFHAGIAGAPVTDWRLYDTHYTERYLGDPRVNPAAYERSSLIGDASRLSRPLLLIHGLADDNVVVAHTLRLSSALLAAGRPHSLLPLSGVTHLAAQEEVAENLLLLQVDFLKRALA